MDGSFFAVAAGADAHRTNRGDNRACVRLDMHLDVTTWLPQVVAISDGEASEAESAAACAQQGETDMN